MPNALPSPSPTRAQLEAILDARHGDLVETPYRHLLLAIAVGERSAVLKLKKNQLQKEVVFDSGAVVDCHSNIATESLGRFLVSTGKISQQDAHDALNASASRGTPLEDILTEKKLIAPSELYRILQQNLGRKLLEPFSWTSGTWEISFNPPQLTSSLRVRVPQLIVTGIIKVEPQDNADAAAATIETKRLVPGAEPLVNIEELRLSVEQQRVMEAARNGSLFVELRGSQVLPLDDVNRVACALLLLGVIGAADPAERFAAPVQHRADPSTTLPSFLDTPPPPVVMPPFFDVPKSTPTAPPASAPAAPAATAGSSAAPSEEVIAAYMGFRRKDSFELFDLEESAGGADITRAFVRMADRYLPTKFDERAPDAVREKAQEIFLAAARAYAELADPIRRQALLNERATKRENKAAAVAALDTTQSRREAGYKRTIIDPEALWKEGRQLAAAGKLREALSNFEIAAECEAQNGTYAAEVAFCRFQLLISPATTALKALKNAIRIDARSGLAYLYAGKVQQALGNELEAQSYLDRAAQLLGKRV